MNEILQWIGAGVVAFIAILLIPTVIGIPLAILAIILYAFSVRR